MKTNMTNYYAATTATMLLTLGLSLYAFRQWTAARKLLEDLAPPARAVNTPPAHQLALATPFRANATPDSMSKGTPVKESLDSGRTASR